MINSGPKDEETKKSEQDGWLDAEVPDLHKEEQTEDVPSLDDLDNDERAQLMAENDRLYSRSLQVDSDIQKLEKQMTELHRLQETFAEKVDWFLLFSDKNLGTCILGNCVHRSVTSLCTIIWTACL